VVVGRAAHEATGFDKDALNRSMKMSVPTMGPSPDFKQWKRNFLNFLSLKAACLIPELATSSRVHGWTSRPSTTHTPYFLAAIDNKRVDKALKCVSLARPDCATAA
jgi:hypothetical protein